MAKILELGKQTWAIERKCIRCDSVIAYDGDDLRYNRNDSDRDDPRGAVPFFYVKCPVDGCGYELSLVNSTIPILLQNKARGR